MRGIGRQFFGPCPHRTTLGVRDVGKHCKMPEGHLPGHELPQSDCPQRPPLYSCRAYAPFRRDRPIARTSRSLPVDLRRTTSGPYRHRRTVKANAKDPDHIPCGWHRTVALTVTTRCSPHLMISRGKHRAATHGRLYGISLVFSFSRRPSNLFGCAPQFRWVVQRPRSEFERYASVNAVLSRCNTKSLPVRTTEMHLARKA